MYNENANNNPKKSKWNGCGFLFLCNVVGYNFGYSNELLFCVYTFTSNLNLIALLQERKKTDNKIFRWLGTGTSIPIEIFS